MSAPRHLWSGDWQLESSARGDELDANRAHTEVPADPEPSVAPRRSQSRSQTRSRTVRELLEALAGRIRALRPRMRTVLRRIRSLPAGSRRQRRIAIVAVALTLLLAGAAYAVTSAVAGGGSGGPTPTGANGSGAWLGIDVSRSPLGGVMVIDVFPGSPAQAAGMEPGDVITQINGHPVISPSDVTSAIAHRQPGDQVQLQFQGSGTTYSERVSLVPRPAGHP